MATAFRSKRNTVLILTALIILGAFIVWTAPEEKTLGQGIRAVYVHVALIWSGMFGLISGGLLGLVIAGTGRKRLELWTHTLTWIALLLFAAGLGMSVVAARVNWGGFFWEEPRAIAALQLLAAGVIVQGLNTLPLPVRAKGFLRSALVLLMVWLSWSTPLILHPRDPARASVSANIRLTFFSLFVLCLMGGGWVLIYLRSSLEANGKEPTRESHTADRRRPTPTP